MNNHVGNVLNKYTYVHTELNIHLPLHPAILPLSGLEKWNAYAQSDLLVAAQSTILSELVENINAHPQREDNLSHIHIIESCLAIKNELLISAPLYCDTH